MSELSFEPRQPVLPGLAHGEAQTPWKEDPAVTQSPQMAPRDQRSARVGGGGGGMQPGRSAPRVTPALCRELCPQLRAD